MQVEKLRRALSEGDILPHAKLYEYGVGVEDRERKIPRLEADKKLRHRLLISRAGSVADVGRNSTNREDACSTARVTGACSESGHAAPGCDSELV
jgi:hypothetical protein